MDVYGYCLDDPINFIDRTGLMAEAESEDEVPSHELSSLKNAGARSTMGQADFAEKRVEAKPAVNKQAKRETAKGAANPADRAGEPDQSKIKFDPYIPFDLHKKAEEHLLKIGMDPSEIAYNSEGHPIVAYNGDGSIIPLKAEGLAKDVNKLNRKTDAKKEEQGVFSKIYSGLSNAPSAIADGLDGAVDKSIEGIKEAVVEGGKAAGEAVGKTAHEFKTNDRLRNTTLGLVALPAAIATVGVLGTTATGVAVGRTVASAGGAVLKEGKAIARGVSKAAKNVVEKVKDTAVKGDIKTDNKFASNKVLKTAGRKNVTDFLTSLNPSTPPAPSFGGLLGSGAVSGVEYLQKRSRLREIRH